MVKKATKTTKTKKPAQSAVKTKKSTTKSKKIVTERAAKPTAEKKLTTASLYAWNKWLALLYAVQGVALLIVSSVHLLPVTTNYLTKDTFVSKSGETPVLAPATRHLFDINIVYLVTALLIIAAITHVVVASVYRKRYEQELAAGVNRVRWAGYGLVAGTAIVTIGLLAGVYDISTLFVLFVLAIIASLSGLAVEVYSQGVSRRRLVYAIGNVAAIALWVVLAVYLIGANVYGSGNIPAFVYFLIGSMFVLSLGFALGVYFRYQKRGKWADYLYSERAYSILAFIAVSALTWQVFVGVLQP